MDDLIERNEALIRALQDIVETGTHNHFKGESHFMLDKVIRIALEALKPCGVYYASAEIWLSGRRGQAG